MNARLQVEHPVTEAVTSRDLVADQIRIAAGERLGFGQGDVRREGHAVEVRLYAEDADAGFLPAFGRIEALHWPAGPGIRVDPGVTTGDDVGGRFDPMLAKIVAHAPSRAMALRRLAAALDETLVLGLVTNLRFLRWLVRQPAVVEGQARIDTLEQIWPVDRVSDGPVVPPDAWAAAAGVLAVARPGDPWSGGWRLAAPARIRLAAEGEERAVDVGPPGGEDRRHVLVGETVHVDVDGRSVAISPAPPPDVDRAARAASAHASAGGRVEIVAPMPGRVVTVHRRAGDAVEAVEPVVTLEAMKMEHVVVAPVAGLVAELAVAAGDQVARGQALGSIEP
jgi:acetyl-CoA/propionyl-CoA carboxylase biotin carboxyl carrier protein